MLCIVLSSADPDSALCLTSFSPTTFCPSSSDFTRGPCQLLRSARNRRCHLPGRGPRSPRSPRRSCSNIPSTSTAIAICSRPSQPRALRPCTPAPSPPCTAGLQAPATPVQMPLPQTNDHKNTRKPSALAASAPRSPSRSCTQSATSRHSAGFASGRRSVA